MKTIVGKVVVLGHQGVGKTSVCIRYTEKNFSPHLSPTIGASFFSCRINIGDIIVKLQIWDTAGQERFKAMAPMFYRNANIALLIFDITQPKTLESIKYWVLELKRNVEEPMVLCLVANKIDLAKERLVTREEALQYANSIGATYYESSAMEDQGIEQVFLSAAKSLIRLSEGELLQSLKVYEGDNGTPLMARSSELKATDVGRTEEPSWSISNVAHATTVSNCC